MSRAARSSKQPNPGARQLRQLASDSQASRVPCSWSRPAGKDEMVGIGLWDTKSDADAWAATGPWRPGAELRERFDGMLTEEPTRQEFEVAYLHVPASS